MIIPLALFLIVWAFIITKNLKPGRELFHRHVWISDLPLSLNGAYALMAGLWMPPSTCKCGKKDSGVNSPRSEWVDAQNGKHWRVIL